MTSASTSKSRPRSLMALRALCEGALMLALAMVLSMLTVFRLPNGGSVDLAMLPVLFYAVRWGVGPGCLVGFLFGLLQIFTEGAVAWGWQSILLDFLVAFTPLGLAGLFRGSRWGIFAGTVLGCAGRFLVHFISGITIYAITIPTELFSITYTSPWMYSLVYNGSYVGIDMVLCLIIFGALYAPLKSYFMGSDLKK